MWNYIEQGKGSDDPFLSLYTESTLKPEIKPHYVSLQNSQDLERATFEGSTMYNGLSPVTISLYFLSKAVS